MGALVKIASDVELIHSLILLSDKVVANVFLDETSLSYEGYSAINNYQLVRYE